MLSMGDADDRSPSRIREMFQVVWLMARATIWHSSTDFCMMASFRRKKATCLGDGSPLQLESDYCYKIMPAEVSERKDDVLLSYAQ